MSQAPLPPQLQEQLVRLQQLQQTYQVVMSQRQQLDREQLEVNRALGELEKMSEKDIVYKSLGAILVKSTRKKLIEELTERKELLDMRIKVITKQQSRTEEQLKELQQRVQQRLNPSS
ncbi:MAG: prefoldin subunit beta [Candidatus Bathyarchaeia archaeon]|jgi:prefoldin beta subunit